jgi:hypothetical protein
MYAFHEGTMQNRRLANQLQGAAPLPLGKDLRVPNKQKAECIPDPE